MNTITSLPQSLAAIEEHDPAILSEAGIYLLSPQLDTSKISGYRDRTSEIAEAYGTSGAWLTPFVVDSFDDIEDRGVIDPLDVRIMRDEMQRIDPTFIPTNFRFTHKTESPISVVERWHRDLKFAIIIGSTVLPTQYLLDVDDPQRYVNAPASDFDTNRGGHEYIGEVDPSHVFELPLGRYAYHKKRTVHRGPKIPSWMDRYSLEVKQTFEMQQV